MRNNLQAAEGSWIPMVAGAGLFALGTLLALAPMTSTPPAMALAATLPKSAPECSPKLALPDLKRPLRAVRRAAFEKRRAVRVLAVGSSTTAGVGASSPSAAYVARLEPALADLMKGARFDVLGRGLSGELAQGAADRMKQEVQDAKPDLVVWQVGTNDAMHQVGIDALKAIVRATIAWLLEQQIDVVLVNPQFGAELTRDAHYGEVVKALSEVARDSGVLLVDRFSAMRELQMERGDAFYLAADNLHLNDTGHRCMADQIARAIVDGVVSAGTDQTARLVRGHQV